MSNISYKHFIYDHELALYPYAPLGLLHNKGQWPKPKHQLSIIASASVENFNVTEWLSYHQALGIGHIYLYCQDEDPTDLYRQIIPFTLGKNPFITFHHFRFSKAKTASYFHFIRNYVHETEWYIQLEITDYLYVNEKQTLPSFLEGFININAVYFNIILYNELDIKKQKNIQMVFQQDIAAVNSPYIYTKLMLRSQSCPYQYIFTKLNNKFDHHIDIEKIINNSCNVLRQSMQTYYVDFPKNALTFMDIDTQNEIIETAYIAHFGNSNELQENTNNSLETYKSSSVSINDLNDKSTVLLRHCTPSKYWDKKIKNIWKQSFLPAPSPSLLNISNNKRCNQSSAPQGKTNEIFAGNLIQGQIKGITQSITNKETDPWWEIDLQKNFIIKNIKLFNGIDLNISNMKHFIIESSEDHQMWVTRHKKTTINLFGSGDGSYYNWIHPLGIKARWIRITVPGKDQVFSLDQIQILGMEYQKYYIP